MGVPVIGCQCDVCVSEDVKDKRLRSSILIETNDQTFVVDTGPDFREQMLREKVARLTAVLYTHEHKDHTAGMDDVRAFNFLQNKPTDLYGSERVHEALKKDYAYVFAENTYPGIPKVDLHLIDDAPFVVEGVEIIPINALHYNLPVHGFRIGDFSYLTDANSITAAELDKMRGSKVVVLNALRKEEHISHFTLAQAVELMEDIRPERGYFIHMSHQMGRHKAIEQELPDWIRLSYDRLQIEV